MTPSVEDSFVLRVLIVDDNDALAQTMGWMVETAGYDYLIAVTPKQALDVAESYAPHVALVDIGLPNMNGFELCRNMRAMPALARTVFVAQTGTESDEYRQRADDAGFEHYMVKPYPMEVLLATLKDIETAAR